MSLEKSCNEILKNVDHSSYESVHGAMRGILKLLSQHDTDPYLGTAISKVEVLKAEAEKLSQIQEEKKQQATSENTNELEIKQNDQNQEQCTEAKTDENNTQKEQQNPTNQENTSNVTEETSQTSKCCLLI